MSSYLDHQPCPSLSKHLATNLMPRASPRYENIIIDEILIRSFSENHQFTKIDIVCCQILIDIYDISVILTINAISIFVKFYKSETAVMAHRGCFTLVPPDKLLQRVFV